MHCSSGANGREKFGRHAECIEGEGGVSGQWYEENGSRLVDFLDVVHPSSRVSTFAQG